jgi:formylglycine-generating enzyme required for sulfatase activity
VKARRKISVIAAVVFSGLSLLVSRADVVFDMTYIGNAGNAPDTTGYGSVGYNYNIGTYEVTVAQYADFLNAAASSDPYGLYDAYMGDSALEGGAFITRSGEDGSYTYTSVSGKENKPVRFVDFYDAARFCNWLYNGQGSGDTESGSYDMSMPVGSFMSREDDATWVLPTMEEWYKAAFYDPVNDCYYDYPNGSDAIPAEPIDETTPRDMNFGDDPWWHGYDVTFTSIGETTGSSPYGVYDMGGNVEEWTESFPPYGSQRLAYGGTYSSDAEGVSYKGVIVRQPDVGTLSRGFRVALVPEPNTVFLLFVGGFLLFIRKRLNR